MVMLRLYLENMAGEWFAWTQDHPGAYARAASRQEAEEDAPSAFSDYLAWLAAHGEPLPEDLRGMTSADFVVFPVSAHPEPADNAWQLQHEMPEDATPMSRAAYDRYLRRLRFARLDLSEAVHAIPPHEWDLAQPGEPSIRAILQSMMQTENALLERAGLEPTLRPHVDPWTTLVRGRSAFEFAVQDAFESGETRRAGASGQWSLAKLLRLAAWHERLITERIAVRSNPTAYLRSVARGEAVVRQRSQDHLSQRPAGAETPALTRHTHQSEYYY